MQRQNQVTQPANAELIATMISYGNLGKNIRIDGKNKEERRAKFREIYYGTKKFKLQCLEQYHKRTHLKL